MCAETTDTPEYKTTLNLPKTDFPMRAGLPKREPEWLARWADMDVYGKLREKAKAETRSRCMMDRLTRTGICTSGMR